MKTNKWGVVVKGNDGPFFREAVLIKIALGPMPFPTIVHSYRGGCTFAHWIEYEEVTIETEEEKQLYSMLYPDWADLF